MEISPTCKHCSSEKVDLEEVEIESFGCTIILLVIRCRECFEISVYEADTIYQR